MTQTAKVSFPYKADLRARDFNQRFADFFGGSVMKGYRFGLTDKNGYISLLKGTDEKNLLITHTGVSIEDEDKKEVIYIHPNDHETNNRIDAIYAVHIHGTDVVDYIAITGNAETEELPEPKPKETHTLLGYIVAPPTNRMLLDEHLQPVQQGLKELRIQGDTRIGGNLDVDGTINFAGDIRMSGSVHRSAFATVTKAGFMTATDKQTVKSLVDIVNTLQEKVDALEKAVGINQEGVE